MKLLFTLLLIAGTCTSAEECSVSDDARQDCFPEAGASESGCTARGCCWSPTSVSGLPWCYYSESPLTSCAVEDASRIDCHPEDGATQDVCSRRGCCWKESSIAGAPWCFQGVGVGDYDFSQVSGVLTSRSTMSPYGAAISPLKLSVTESAENVRFKIYDSNEERYEVPMQIPVHPTASIPPGVDKPYSVSYSTSPFSVAVNRKGAKTPLFDTSIGPLLFKNQYLQLSTRLPSLANVYGLGEHSLPFSLSTVFNSFSLFARDVAPGPPGKNNLYGSHPFALVVTEDGSAHGVFLYSSNAVEAVLQGDALTFRVLGGVLDFFVLLGPTPADVVRQYNDIVGKPYMPPYWSLGFHLCRWGYEGGGQGTAAVVQRMRDAGVPQDVQWNDIDYMDRYLDFTHDPDAFGNLPSLVDDLHAQGQRYVMIVDPGISSTQPAGSYAPYDEGLDSDVFILDHEGEVLIGKVWPGETAYPDFLAPNATQWWTNQVASFHKQFAFDGLWIDMNEPSNFYTGSSKGCPSESSLEIPPYVPDIVDNQMAAKTVCMSATQHRLGGAAGSRVSHYDVHNLYGYSESVATADALKAVRGERQLVISRSTFPGSGVHAGHWLGDNTAEWSHLRASIAGVLTFNLLGVPLVGADICGFNGNTTEELCTRWMQLGAFYPFSRNHNTIGALDQDPVAFSPAMTASSRSALLTRYSLLPLLYTLFYNAHVGGSAVATSLMMQFPHDAAARALDAQFMWGDALLITPVLDQGAITVTGYFPPSARWYDLRSGEELVSGGRGNGLVGMNEAGRVLRGGGGASASEAAAAAGWVTLNAPLNYIPLHLKGGTVVPTQTPTTTTAASRVLPMQLLVAVDGSGAAAGQLYLDDGVALDSITAGRFTLVDYSAKVTTLGGSVTATPRQDQWSGAAQLTLESVRVMGAVGSVPTAATVTTAGGEQRMVSVMGGAAAGVLDFTDLAVAVNEAFTLAW